MIREAILNGADAIDARGSFDPADRARYMNASEALTCIRKQWYGKHADPAQKDKPEDWGYARRGKAGERYMVECLRAANVPVLFGGTDQVQIADDDLMISCTPDGLIFDGDGWLACEFKTIDPRTNRGNLPREEHVRQVQIAAAMFAKHGSEFPELQGLPVKGCRLIYMDASNFNDILDFPVPLKPSILDQLKGRASRVLTTKDAGRLPREGAVGNKAECKQRCPWNKLCGVDGVGTSTGQGQAGSADMSSQVAAYLAAKADEEAAGKVKAATAENIKKLLAASSTSTMEVDGHRATISSRAGAVSYAKVVKDHCPDVDLEPYRGAPTQVLTVG